MTPFKRRSSTFNHRALAQRSQAAADQDDMEREEEINSTLPETRYTTKLFLKPLSDDAISAAPDELGRSATRC